MLRKAREKAKEGFHSVQSETKRYLQSRHQGGGPRGSGHGPRSSRHQPTSAGPSFMSFKGVDNNEFEAILNDESDFTNQFDESYEAPGTGPSSIEEEERVPLASGGGNHGTDENFHMEGDSDLFSDPLFSESKRDISLPDDSHTNSADLLFAEDPLGLTISDDHQDNEFTATIKEADNAAIPNSDNAHSVSGNTVSPSDVLNDSRDEVLLPESVAEAHDPLPPDSPLFSDDVVVGSTNHMEDDSKKDNQLNARILITQPSNESPQPSQKLGADENRDEQLGEGCNQQSEEDTIDIHVHELPKPSTPDLPDIEELEQNLAVSKIESGQDLFSSEESPFSSLASSYEGDKVLGTMATTAGTLSHTENTKSGHDESELFEEVVSAVVKEVNGHTLTTTGRGLGTPSPQPTDNRQQQPAAAMYSLDEELEMLLTPKQKNSSTAPSYEPDCRPPCCSSEPGLLHQSTNTVVDDPLQAISHLLVPGRDSLSSHLDSGVFEHSGSSSTLKATPEREGIDSTNEDDLFPIDEDHFKDDDDSTPVPVRRQLLKGSSNIEVSQLSKKVLQNTISAPAIVPPDLSKTSSGSPPLKKKVAPPRPAISPKLKHRMTQKQSVSSSSIGGHHEDYTARKKLVQPLGQAPQGSRDTERDHSPVRVETGVDSSSISSDTIAVPPPAGRRGGSASPSKQDEKRIPADDLFLEDNLASPRSDGVEKLQSKVAEVDETTSEDEETHNYILFHFLFAGLLYFYYSLNIFPYLSGFFAGFFVLYLTVGSVFIFYVQTVEKYQSGEGKEDRLLEPSQDFTELMHVDFDNLRVYKVSHSYEICARVRVCVCACKVFLIEIPSLWLYLPDSSIPCCRSQRYM